MATESQCSLLGSGWNTFEETSTNQAIDFKRQVLDTSVECKIYVCESAQEISEHMSISGSVGYQSVAVDFEAKAGFLRDLAKKSNSVTLLVKAKRTYSAQVTDADLKSKVINSGESAQKMLKYTGDSYISYVQTGVEYYASYQFTAYSQEQKDKITASAQGSFGKLSKVSASLSAELEKVSKESGSSYTFDQRLIGNAEALPDHESVSAFALNIADRPAPNPKLLYFRTTPYSNLLNAPDGFDKIDAWMKAYNNPTWYRLSLRSIERQARIARDSINVTRALYRFYDGDGLVAELDRRHKGCDDAIRAIKNWRLAFNSDDGAPPKPVLDIDCLAMPSANFEIKGGQTWGRLLGGNSWTDVDRYSVYAFVYPKSWRGKGELVLDQLTTVYAYRDPLDAKNESKEKTIPIRHGGDGGRFLTFDQTFAPKSIRHFGAWADRRDHGFRDTICGLEFYQKGDDASYMLGHKNGDYHGDQIPADAFFLGFSGRSDHVVDALRPLWVKFSEPEWTPVPDE